MPKGLRKSRRTKNQRRSNRKTRSKMYGGQLISSGNNTCVYNPAIECVDESEKIPPNHISRIVPSDSKEPAAQTKIKAALAKINPKYLKHFNLATKICKAKFKQTDLIKQCSVEKLSDTIKVGDTDLVNMLTPIQESDINRSDNGKFYKNLETTNAAMKDFLHALVEMNSYSVQVFHTDAHLGNFSWKGDSIVLHDWEKTIVGDANLLKEINASTPDSWKILGYTPTSSARRYLSGFPCWVHILDVIDRSIDRWHGLFPPNHKTVHLGHEILFRFWDLFSIIIPLNQVYLKAEVKMPEFIKKIGANLKKYYYDTFKEEAGVSLNGRPDIEDRKTKLDKITNKIHEIIDTTYSNKETSEKAAVNGELLKLVAQHANSSPAKQVLQNLLPSST